MLVKGEQQNRQMANGHAEEIRDKVRTANMNVPEKIICRGAFDVSIFSCCFR